jgi:protein-disulfide isomerase
MPTSLASGARFRGDLRVLRPLDVAHPPLFAVEDERTGVLGALALLEPAPSADALSTLSARTRAASSAHVAEALEAGIDAPTGAAYVLYEALAGEPLSARLADAAPVSTPMALSVLLPVARALASAHESGLVHGALRPEHVWFRSKGSAARALKVVGFGLALGATASAEADVRALGALAEEWLGAPGRTMPKALATFARQAKKGDFASSKEALAALEALAEKRGAGRGAASASDSARGPAGSDDGASDDGAPFFTPSRTMAAVALASALAAGGVWWSSRSAPSSGTAEAVKEPVARAAREAWKQDCAVPVSSDDPQLGPRDAPVTIVVFSDFECPFCARAEPALRQAREEYGDRIRIVWKDLPLPFHQKAMPAAIAARVAFLSLGAEAFWKVHDQIFDLQRELSASLVQRLALDAGVSRAALTELDAEARKAVREGAELAERLGIQGTPNFLVDGEPLEGAVPIEELRKVIDAHLAQAATLRAAGTKPADLYSAMVKANWKGPKKQEPEQPAEGPPELDPQKRYAVEVGDSASVGPADALVTLVIFSEFQCPFCKRFAPAGEGARAAYPGKVRVVFKHRPLGFHPRARPASTLAEEAFAQKGAEAFWKAHDALFASQPKLDDDDLLGVATRVGLDRDKAAACIESDCRKARIDADGALADALGINGTPTSFVNGRPLVGALGPDEVNALVGEELEAAAARVKAGLPAKSLYATLLEESLPGPGFERKELGAGKGDGARAGDEVKVHVVAKAGGEVFLDTRKAGAPLSVRLGDGSTARGLDYGLRGLAPGGKRALTLPAPLAARGAGAWPSPRARTAEYEVELVSRKPGKGK